MIARRALWGTVMTFVVAACAAACGGTSITVGSEPNKEKPEEPPPVVGDTWTGYFENHRFASGSDRISITFDTPTTGTVTLGEDAVAPGPVDANVGYPSWVAGFARTDVTRGELLQKRAERVRYAIQFGIANGGQRRFAINLREIWTQWCAAQSSHAWSENRFQCLPQHSAIRYGTPGAPCEFEDDPNLLDGIDGTLTPVECSKLTLCYFSDVCACGPSGCSLSPDVEALSINLELGTEEGTGNTDLGPIKLQRKR